MTVRNEDNASTLELVGDLLRDVRTLIRQETALVRAEIREEIVQAVVALAVLAVAAGTLGLAGLWVLVAVTRGIAYLFNWPLAAVYAAVGAALGIVGLVLLAIAWHQLRTLEMLPKTRETLRGRIWLGLRRVKESV
jgi:Putative Actinobacterial Holin-X, holin superfamily III